MRWFNLLLLFIISSITHQLFAQIPDFRNILPGETLAQNCITCIYQDRNDYLWFGTKYGLLKYDGYDFKVYKINPADPLSIKGNFIRDLFEDSKGNFWIATDDGGLNFFEPSLDRFTFIETDIKKKPGPEGTYTWAVESDSRGIIWIGHVGAGLSRLDPKSNKVNQYLHDPKNPKSLSDDNVKCIFIDKNDILWIGTEEGGLNRFDPKTETFAHFKKEEGNSNAIQDNNIWDIVEDHKRNLWIATHSNGLFKYDKTSEIFTSYLGQINGVYPNQITNIMCIFQDQQYNMWAGGWHNGVFTWQQEDDKVLNFLLNQINQDLIPITSINSDRSGLIWIGTEYHGLFVKNPFASKFEFLSADNKGSSSLSNNHIHSLCEDENGNLLIGTYGGGINLLNTDSKKMVDWKGNHIFKQQEEINCLATDKKMNTWVGTNKGLFYYPSNGKGVLHFTHDPKDSSSISNNYIYCLTVDSAGKIWAGTIRHGINVIDPATYKITHYKHIEGDTGSLSTNNIRCFAIDHKNNMWVGTLRGGLNKFNEKNSTFTHYKNHPDNINSLSNNSIWDIYIDKIGIMWLGTDGGGLNTFNPETEDFTYFTVNDGLPSDVICGIIGDAKGHIWVSTPNGLSNYHSLGQTFFNYNENDGLQKQEFIPGSVLRSSKGIIYFGGYGGLNYFHPDSLNINPTPPSVHISSIENFQKQITANNNQIKIESENNMLRIGFTAISYIQPEKIQYAYRLKGYDTSWNYVKTSRTAFYDQLPAGSYDFQVKASNNDGIWNEEGTHLQIEVITPFFRSAKFLLLLIILIPGITVSILFIRKKLNKKKIKQDRYKGSTLKQKDAALYNRKLMDLMRTANPYLEYSLNLNKCARMLDVPPHHLSQVINQFHHKNFSDYINEYRIEEAKRLIRETNLKVEAIGFESGFNSPTAFYAAFKKFTQKTPTQYRKSIS
jgi:ligand-binding sensor domain-containing protein/AraC-like DNA-binding protein